MIKRFFARPALVALGLFTPALLLAQPQKPDPQTTAEANPPKISAETAPRAITANAAPAEGWDPAMWDLEDSEFTPEPGWTFGQLENGLRYIIRPNNRPEGTAIIRMEIATGSLDERDDERGFAHYVEHMAFNGSPNVPEGEMIKLLERLGLAFGADTNAVTSFDSTRYMLDLPRVDEELLDTALMLMRETVSELSFAPDAVEREKGVILAERRTRNNFALKNVIDNLEFAYPDARLAARLPIGTLETIEAADAARLRAFWSREYVPADTVLVVIGDFDPALVEAKIIARFADWQAAPSPEQPDPGPVDLDLAGQSDIYLDPALSESIALMRHAPYIDRHDTLAERKAALLRSVGAGAAARRLQRLRRSEDPPFKGASFGNSDFFENARTAQLAISSEEGEWQRALSTAIAEYRRVFEYGFTEAEIAEQVTNLRTGLENRAANAETRSHARFASAAFAIARAESVRIAPQEALASFEAFAPQITPEAVLDAMREEFVALDDPLIRFTGKTAPEGGIEAVRDAVAQAFAQPIAPPEQTQSAAFAYTDFGPPSEVISDTRTDALGIRTLRFANGVMLNLKTTDLADDRIAIKLSIDGGQMVESRAQPLAAALTPLIPAGGLAAHSSDELQSILAGKSVSAGFGAAARSFVSNTGTTPRDLELQLQLLAAFVTDPGYRAEGLGPWRSGLPDFFARLGRTPGSALSEATGPALSDNDPRFTRQPIEAYQALSYERLEAAIGERMRNGALEIALVGDFEEDRAIELVAKTLGALPQRETAFRSYDDPENLPRRTRSFTRDRSPRTVYHQGEPDQALVRLVWPTADNSDWELTSRLSLLARVMRLELNEVLREELGQTYSPSASSSQSETYIGYGTFTIGAGVDVDAVSDAANAMRGAVKKLIEEGPSEDTVARARQPLIEALDNRLKSNGGWLGLTDRAQSRPQDIARFLSAKSRQSAITADELKDLAGRYLALDQAVQFTVLPDPAMAKPAPDQ